MKTKKKNEENLIMRKARRDLKTLRERKHSLLRYTVTEARM